MHILRIANFVSPTSGGIKTALREWGEVYRARGHRVSLVIPEDGRSPSVSEEPQGMVYRVPAWAVPRTGYSLIWSRSGLSSLMGAIRPDSIEVSDRSTLRWTGRWARQRDPRVGSVMISHEHMTGILDRRTPLPARPARGVADAMNRRSAGSYDAIVCPSRFAAEEFLRTGLDAHVVPLGVDLETFTPQHSPGRADGRTLHLIHCGRLSREKNPGLSIETVRELTRRGHDVHMTVLGHGPMRATLKQQATGLPVMFHPYIHGRHELAAAIGPADVALAPGPVETFGLAALEALACGVPTVCPVEGALGEVVGLGGVVSPSTPEAFANGVEALIARPDARSLARTQAERFTWDTSADRMLRLHQQVAHSCPG
ncbi:MAG: glycosyltransferase [Ornithinimicrobium sp.]